MNDRPPVRIEAHVEMGLQTVTDIVTVDRDEWEAMTPKQRDQLRAEAAVTLQNNEEARDG